MIMPPFYDIYAISNNRDKKTIEEFLDNFSFRNKIEVREDHEIGVSKNEDYDIEELIIPISTLSEVIEFGINNRGHGFVFYISDNLKSGIKCIILKFTYDEKVIFGISVEEKDENLNDNYKYACKVKNEIVKITDAYESSIQFEYPPSDDEGEFYKDIKLWENVNNEKRQEFGIE